MEKVQESFVRCQPSKERSVEAVHRLAKTSEKKASDQPQRRRMDESRPLFEESFVVGLTALHDLDGSDIAL